MEPKMESWLQDCLHRAEGNYLHIENQATWKTSPAMWRILYTNHQLSCGMLTQHLAELKNL